ncbi:4-(cytidine 5'-diphospho)-2-C-methyl-D-erythritol kinase [Xylanibacter oryzae]|uniref:4-(cytidine 5'-diphospho)-2-C-methyl-D-erythritol kinase n=1 Tax=Xylanibacter oryzae TaxID=185293 RepID=UPI0004AEEF50|nr:4-(cytidine 5'-diphospho)-2-C-methyl-D-erythritol kinase [Xylanibacter oryzae]
MITRPCAKINFGLNIVGIRPDGYHNIETIFYPVPIYDDIEITEMDPLFTSLRNADLKITGTSVDCDEQKNLVIKAYNLLSADFNIPRIHIHLYKNIPMQAGMGGGSADCAYAIKLLNRQFDLGLTSIQMKKYAAKLGADCAFFIDSVPSYATGIGDILSPINVNFNGYSIVVVKPPVAVSTAQAYSKIIPASPTISCIDAVKQPVETWHKLLSNDFEKPIFAEHPEIAYIKKHLYDLGAVFSMMSGSGSAVFGIFKKMPSDISKEFSNCITITEVL